VVDGPTIVNRHSVISQNHYTAITRPDETLVRVMDGQKPRLLMDIHNVSEVNQPQIELSELQGPATGEVFDENLKINRES
ncbi:MAG: Fe-S-binding domain-containing protein, partial [Chitinophagaceae bacterium]